MCENVNFVKVPWDEPAPWDCGTSIYALIAEKIVEEVDDFMYSQFQKYGYSRDQVIEMIADGRIVKDNMNQVCIDGEPYFEGWIMRDDLYGITEIKVRYIKEPTCKEGIV
jgi:hypothetical protein